MIPLPSWLDIFAAARSSPRNSRTVSPVPLRVSPVTPVKLSVPPSATRAYAPAELVSISRARLAPSGMSVTVPVAVAAAVNVIV